MNKYYLLNGRKRSGPFTLTELKTQVITDRYLVWSEDMNDWKNVTEVEELKELVVKTPPLTPKEVKLHQRKIALVTGLKKGTTWLIIIGLFAFVVMGGFGSDKYLERIYKYDSDGHFVADVSEIRWPILPGAALIFVAFPIAILIGYFKYRIEMSVTDQSKGEVKRAINPSVCIVAFLPVFFLVISLFDGKLDEQEIDLIKDAFPYLPIYLLLFSILLFLWIHKSNKKVHASKSNEE